jgi:CRP/FNR family transcriptional regulator, cyclic AMP receptor protein
MSAIDSQDALYELLARAGDRRQVPAGTVIFEQGEHANSMFVLVSGTVGLRRGDEVVHSLQAPALFGEMALIDLAPRSLTAVAQDDVEVVEIPARHFWVLVQETPRFAQLVMSVMADRLRQLSNTV